MNRYIIASRLPWFSTQCLSDELKQFSFVDINTNSQLTIQYLNQIKPRYVFFTHWSWLVPQAIYEKYECVVFHTAPLPYGRGGSPIQNLIIRGFQSSPVCALKMNGIVDGGPLYCSEEVLLEGTINDIFMRICTIVNRLILYICLNEPEPREQVGEPFCFKRLNRNDNHLKPEWSLNEIYDRIRMVDGLDYPRAFMTLGTYIIEFTDAQLQDNELQAHARIKKSESAQ